MELFQIIILIATVIIGGYMAWNIGANDVANAMGTSVGSGAISLKKAIIIAGIFEFLGAVLVGSHVTKTVKGGIIPLESFVDTPELLVWGMLSALLAAGIFLHLATTFALPVSTTHSIIGALAGFGIISVGFFNINWETIGKVVLSWVVSPLAGALFAFIIFFIIKQTILFSNEPLERIKKVAPFLIFIISFILVHSFLFKGLKNLHLDLNFSQASIYATIFGILASILCFIIIRKMRLKDHEDQIDFVERVFRNLLIITASYVCFAHGANDVANAIGPVAAIYSAVVHKTVATGGVQIPIWILVIGGLGIVIGLATWGYKVLETVGKKITELTPTRAFSAEFGAATTVLVCSKLGMPVSTTHVVVGAIIGVAVARGVAALNTDIIKTIFASWIFTVPLAAVFTMIIYSVIMIFN